ncbi:gas1-like protein [Hypoxylon cercidicola]|nr:gas1-like protein [Hypoxylon cercidicola]
MPSFSSILSLASLLALAQAHGALIAVQGIEGSPQGVGFKVVPDLARNCTSISPCQQDTTLIRDAEIAANIVGECGRTELSGNIDVDENTENQLAAGVVTQVKSGTQLKVTIHQVNADGAGPYACDLVEAGDNGVITQNLTVQNNVPGVNGFSQAKEQDFDILVNMPDSFACTGSSAGNVCTVRCRNNALAGPFGGCFPVQQVDAAAAPANAAKGSGKKNGNGRGNKGNNRGKGNNNKKRAAVFVS